MPEDPDALMAWLNLGADEADDDSELTDVDSADADLIIADLDLDGPEAEEPAPLSATAELDELFDEISGEVDGEILDEDLIFGDLGTGRLSGSEWLDRMTFDSDPALLGDVPTIPPQKVPVDDPADNIIEDILDGIDSEESDFGAIDATLESLESSGDEVLGTLEELPDDPDEFLKILESNVEEVPSSEIDAAIEELIDSPHAVESSDPDVPDFLKLDSDNSDESLGWLEDATPSGVFNWLEAEESVEQEQTSEATESPSEGNTQQLDREPSMFDAPLEDSGQGEASTADEFQTMLASGENISEVIRQIRNQLEVRNDSALQKLLGDAYMETGQLQDALDAYRQAQRLL